MINTEFYELIETYGETAKSILKYKGYTDEEIERFYTNYEENKQLANKLKDVYSGVYDYNNKGE